MFFILETVSNSNQQRCHELPHGVPCTILCECVVVYDGRKSADLQRWWFDSRLPYTTCWSVIGQDTEPHVASDVWMSVIEPVTLYRPKLCCMSVCLWMWFVESKHFEWFTRQEKCYKYSLFTIYGSTVLYSCLTSMNRPENSELWNFLSLKRLFYSENVVWVESFTGNSPNSSHNTQEY